MNHAQYVSKRMVILSVAAVLLALGCQKSDSRLGDEVISGNLVRSSDSTANRKIGDEKAGFTVVGQKALTDEIIKKTVLSAGSLEGKLALGKLVSQQADVAPEPTPNPAPPVLGSLTVGYPIGLLGEYAVFGGVITKVSDTKNEDLGMLKLTDLTPLHTRSAVAKDEASNYYLALNGCVSGCTETSQPLNLLYIPIVAIDTANNLLMLDFAALGSELNLIGMMDPDGEYTKLKTKSSATTAVDFSVSTLVFDVETKMVPLDTADDATDAPETTFSVRWYMRLNSVFNPAFVPRTATNGVGFFMTERTSEPKIHRFSQFALGTGDTAQPQIHYYVKNVPTAYRGAFAAAFDGWNEKFTALTGKKLIQYEFVETTDPRYALLVPGDIRFNILEWDLVNVAPYGGLGPSIANQHTGEILSSNVLIQGPTIITIYTKWFGLVTEAEELRANGHVAEANALLLQGKEELQKLLPKQARSKFSVGLGKHLQFRVTSQLPALEDPLFARGDFEEIPAGVTFESYMNGYFNEMVAHELGHNIGLRHNFRGNLSAKPGVVLGGVSHSIMEYLGRGFRHMNRISNYDEMAIAYGYSGKAPTNTGLYCTDENVVSPTNLLGSPECSRDDATADPFSFFEQRLARAVNLLVARGSLKAPEWKVADLESQLSISVTGLTYYASRAGLTAASWTNFFTGGDRPTTAADVKGYVLAKLKAQLCDPALGVVVAAKEDEAAQKATLNNITALRVKVALLAAPEGAFGAAELACSVP